MEKITISNGKTVEHHHAIDGKTSTISTGPFSSSQTVTDVTRGYPIRETDTLTRKASRCDQSHGPSWCTSKSNFFLFFYLVCIFNFRFTRLPSGSVKIAIENDDFQWIYPLKMVIFHSYVQLPEGTIRYQHLRAAISDISWCTSSFFVVYFVGHLPRVFFGADYPLVIQHGD